MTLVDSATILTAVSRYFSLPVEDITGRCRLRAYSQARHVAVYLLRKRRQLSYPQIALVMNHRDHTSVMYAAKKIEALVCVDDELRRHVETIERTLFHRPLARTRAVEEWTELEWRGTDRLELQEAAS